MIALLIKGAGRLEESACLPEPAVPALDRQIPEQSRIAQMGQPALVGIH